MTKPDRPWDTAGQGCAIGLGLLQSLVHHLLLAQLGDAAGFGLPAPARLPGRHLGLGRGEHSAPASLGGLEF